MAKGRNIRGVKRHLRRLERLLADAAKKEGKRIRKLERARWRRQRLEAEIMVIRGAPAAPAPVKAAPVKAAPVKAAPASKPVTSRAAPRRTSPRAAPAKPASPRRAPRSGSTSTRTRPGKASPGDGATPKT